MEDGIEQKKLKEDGEYSLGGSVEDIAFGIHEFLELCRQLECDLYIKEMLEWNCAGDI
jgi:alpha-L-arabinofuranosidase